MEQPDLRILCIETLAPGCFLHLYPPFQLFQRHHPEQWVSPFPPHPNTILLWILVMPWDHPMCFRGVAQLDLCSMDRQDFAVDLPRLLRNDATSGIRQKSINKQEPSVMAQELS